MKFITVSNKPHPGLELYKASAKQCGIQPIILGMGDSRQLGHGSGHFGVKLDYVYQYLNSVEDKEELILFTDAWDIVFVDSAELIERKANYLLQNGAHAIFAAEKYESPKTSYPYVIDKYSKDFPYLNSGAYVGKAKNLLLLLQRFSTWPKSQQDKTDDQEYFISEYFATNTPRSIVLDHSCFLFACMLHSNAMVLKGKVVMPTRTLPSILHFQGYEKNILPFVNPDLRSLAAPLQNYNKKSIIKIYLEWIGEYVPGKNYNFYKGLYFLLYIILILIIIK